MSLSVLKDIRKIYAGLNADEIRGAAHRDLNIGLMAATEEGRQEMESFLAPASMDAAARDEALRAVHLVDGSPRHRFDFVLCEAGVPAPANGYTFNPADTGSLLKTIATDHEDLELPIARRFPHFRRAVSDRIIHRISRENALFALVTALPNIVPSVIDLPWAIGEFATDTAFLTMNQIRMALLMAGAHDNTIGYTEQKAQIAVIAAGAFGWRALARELVGKIPLGGGLIPKAAVAFAGTYVVGLGLEKVNRTGIGLSRREKKDAYADAFAKGKEVVRELAPAGLGQGEARQEERRSE
ncbi:MAG TPA: hypothetical protein VG297_24710 [Bryobacteraceae bacterium]|nr:hypothetical protein [Bryobacteraceae bacterium]